MAQTVSYTQHCGTDMQSERNIPLAQATCADLRRAAAQEMGLSRSEVVGLTPDLPQRLAAGKRPSVDNVVTMATAAVRRQCDVAAAHAVVQRERDDAERERATVAAAEAAAYDAAWDAAIRENRIRDMAN